MSDLYVISLFLLFTIYCSCALLYASYPHHSADVLRCCFFVYKIRERERELMDVN